METNALICSANRWVGFFIVGITVKKELLWNKSSHNVGNNGDKWDRLLDPALIRPGIFTICDALGNLAPPVQF